MFFIKRPQYLNSHRQFNIFGCKGQRYYHIIQMNNLNEFVFTVFFLYNSLLLIDVIDYYICTFCYWNDSELILNEKQDDIGILNNFLYYKIC